MFLSSLWRAPRLTQKILRKLYSMDKSILLGFARDWLFRIASSGDASLPINSNGVMFFFAYMN